MIEDRDEWFHLLRSRNNNIQTMKLVVDGTIFESGTYGGIARIFFNILPLICDLDSRLRIILLFKTPPQVPYPRHRRISLVVLDDLQKVSNVRLWKQNLKKIQGLYLKFFLGNTKKSIWLSTYFTLPPSYWQGKQVVWIYDLIYELFPELLSGGQMVVEKKKKAILAADKVLSISSTTAQDLKKFYPVDDKNIIVAHLSCDAVFSVREKSRMNFVLPYHFILYVGKRGRYKGYHTLLEAYSNWNQNNESNLVVVGPDWSTEELVEIKGKGLDGKIILLKNINDDVLCDLYNQAEVFIYPSLYEGFGIPLLEAMACGCPVIASRIPSTVEVAGNIPIYFEPDGALSLTGALNFSFSSADLQIRIEQGLALSKQYSWEKTATKFYRVLNELEINA